jgi:hypothetical protein
MMMMIHEVSERSHLGEREEQNFGTSSTFASRLIQQPVLIARYALILITRSETATLGVLLFKLFLSYMEIIS